MVSLLASVVHLTETPTLVQEELFTSNDDKVLDVSSKGIKTKAKVKIEIVVVLVDDAS